MMIATRVPSLRSTVTATVTRMLVRQSVSPSKKLACGGASVFHREGIVGHLPAIGVAFRQTMASWDA